MLCPDCGKEMVWQHGIGHHIDFSGTAEDWELEYYWETYKCKKCKIQYSNNEWTVPKNKAPTEKQRNTILFINNRLHIDLKCISKHQCWVDIGKYFEEAKRTPLHTDDYYEDMQEYFGMSEADFC